MNEEELLNLLTECVTQSVNDAFQATLSLAPETTESIELTDEECIISSIGFTGNIEGSFAICLPNSSACSIVSKMICSDIDDITLDVVDGIGEIINMVAGGVKMKLAPESLTYEIGIPTTIKGNRMVILSDFNQTTRISVNYNFNDIHFTVSCIYKIKEVKNKEEKEKQKKRAEAFARLSNLSDGTK